MNTRCNATSLHYIGERYRYRWQRERQHNDSLHSRITLRFERNGE